MSDLPATLAAAWDTLDAGTRDRAAPARHIVLATTGPHGPEARLLVLRATDRTAGTLTLWTDTATAKTAELAQDPRAALLVWDPEARLQIRLRARLTLRPGTPAEWSALPDAAKALYGGTPAPGAPDPVPRRPRDHPRPRPLHDPHRHHRRDRNPPPRHPPRARPLHPRRRLHRPLARPLTRPQDEAPSLSPEPGERAGERGAPHRPHLAIRFPYAIHTPSIRPAFPRRSPALASPHDPHAPPLRRRRRPHRRRPHPRPRPQDVGHEAPPRRPPHPHQPRADRPLHRHAPRPHRGPLPARGARHRPRPPRPLRRTPA